ncbi:MAG: carbohydrate porin, partial [Myxococcales bacterium]|nr:carbohydrate porin [Myxococcales bacterium]
EGSVSVRPHIYIHKYFQQVFEVSFQFRNPFGIDPTTGGRLFPQIWQIAIMPTFSVGSGTYTRPQIRLIYALSVLNNSARRTYAEDDPRRNQKLQHFLGVGVEWWFNSSYR